MAEYDPLQQSVKLHLDIDGIQLSDQYQDMNTALSDMEKLAAKIGERTVHTAKDVSQITNEVMSMTSVMGDLTTQSDALADVSSRLTAAHAETVPKLEAQVRQAVIMGKLQQELGESVEDTVGQLKLYDKHINEILTQSDELEVVADDIRTSYYKLRLDIQHSIKSLTKGVELGEKWHKALTTIGLGKLANIAASVGSISALMQGLISITGEYIKDLGRWRQANFALYGSMYDIAAISRGLGRDMLLTAEQTNEAINAAAQVQIPVNKLEEFAGQMGIVTKETGASLPVLATFYKRMDEIDASGSQLRNTLGGLIFAQTKYALTGQEADAVLSSMSENAFELKNRLSATDFEDYGRKMMIYAAAAKTAGANLQSMLSIQEALVNDASKFAFLLGGALVTESDPAEMFKIMGRNAQNALGILDQVPAAFRNIVSQDAFGMSADQLEQLRRTTDEIKNVEAAATAAGMTFDEYSKHLRFTQDPAEMFAVLMSNIRQSLKSILDLMRPVIIGINEIVLAFNNLSDPMKLTLVGAGALTTAFIALKISAATLATIFTGLTLPISGTAIAIGAAVIGIGILLDKLGLMEPLLNGIWKVVQTVFTGVKDIYTDAFGEIKEAFASVMVELTPLIDKFTQSWKRLQPFVDVVVEHLIPVGELMVRALLLPLRVVVSFVADVVSAALTTLADLIGAVNAALEPGATWWDRLALALHAVTIPTRFLINLFSNLWQSIYDISDALWGHSLGPDVIEMGKTFGTFADILKIVVIPIMDVVRTAIETVGNIAQKIIGGITTGFEALMGAGGGGGIAGIAKSVVNNMLSAFDTGVDYSEAMAKVTNFNDFMTEYLGVMAKLAGSEVLASIKGIFSKIAGLFGGDTQTQFINDINKSSMMMRHIIGSFMSVTSGLDITNMEVQARSLFGFMTSYLRVIQKASEFNDVGLSDLGGVADKLSSFNTAMKDITPEIEQTVKSSAIVTVKADLEARQDSKDQKQLLTNINNHLVKLIEYTSGLTQLAERDAPDEIRELLRQYLPQMVEETSPLNSSMTWRNA